MGLDLNRLEELSRSRLWGGEGVQEVKDGLSQLIAEVKAAREWLMLDILFDTNDRLELTTVEARQAYRKIVEQNTRYTEESFAPKVNDASTPQEDSGLKWKKDKGDVGDDV